MLLSCLHSFRAAEEWIGDRMRWNPVVECWMNCFVVFTSGVFRSVEKMLRRKPTRLELKIDDIEEFESVKKELEVQILFFLVWSVFSLINRNTTILSLIQWFFFVSGQEASERGGRVRRRRFFCDQCWHHQRRALSFSLFLLHSIKNRPHQWTNRLQAAP